MVRRISQGSCETSSWTDIFQSSPRRESRLVWGLAAFIAVFRREQTPACAVVSLHVGVGVILTAKAPNRRRSLRPFGGRDDAGPRSRNTGERKWTRPHCSSSSSWCCCSAAADSSTDAGFESDGRFARRHCSPLPGAVADLGGIGDRTRRESTIDIPLHAPFTLTRAPKPKSIGDTWSGARLGGFGRSVGCKLFVRVPSVRRMSAASGRAALRRLTTRGWRAASAWRSAVWRGYPSCLLTQ